MLAVFDRSGYFWQGEGYCLVHFPSFIVLFLILQFLPFFFFKVFISFFLRWVFAAVQAFSLAVESRGCSLVAVRGFLIAAASLVSEHGL